MNFGRSVKKTIAVVKTLVFEIWSDENAQPAEKEGLSIIRMLVYLLFGFLPLSLLALALFFIVKWVLGVEILSVYPFMLTGFLLITIAEASKSQELKKAGLAVFVFLLGLGILLLVFDSLVYFAKLLLKTINAETSPQNILTALSIITNSGITFSILIFTAIQVTYMKKNA